MRPGAYLLRRQLDLAAALAVARAENEQLLQQMTRLALVVEQHTPFDPIEVMHGRYAPPPAAAATSGGEPATKPAAAAAAAAAPSSSSTSAVASVSDDPAAAAGGWGSWLYARFVGQEAEADPGGEKVFQWSPVDDARDRDEAVDELQDALLANPRATEVRLDGGGLTRLPSAPDAWRAMEATLHTLLLNGNALSELPAAVGGLAQLRRLALEGNLLRVLPPPVLRLRGLQELWLGCNQLSGLPEAFGELRQLVDLWLVSNEITYLPASFGNLTQLRRLELSANALHELPRAFSRLASLRKPAG